MRTLFRLYGFVFAVACGAVLGVLWLPEGGDDGGKAWAQRAQCAGFYDAIVTLRPLSFDDTADWRALEGYEYGYDEFRDIAPGPEKEMIAVGVARRQGGRHLNPFLVRLSNQGKMLFSQHYEEDGERTFENVVYDGQHIVVAGATRDEEQGLTGFELSYISLENGDGEKGGEIVKSVSLFDQARTHHYRPMDLALSADGQEISALVWAKARAQSGPHYSFLVQFDRDGTLLRRRNYRPGPNNKLVSLTPIASGEGQSGGYAATGWIIQDGGIKAGWLVQLGPSGYLTSQQGYRRGRSSVLNRAVPHPQGGLFVVGESDPIEPPPNNQKAAWGLWISARGEIAWQRYWRSDYAMSGRDAIVVDGEDKRLQVMIYARSQNPSQSPLRRDHTKILTLTTRGQLLDEESYVEGGHTTPMTMLALGDGRRAIAGRAQTVFSQDSLERPVEEGLFDGWVVMAPQPGRYRDPCQ